jgi:PIN domain nuclease of toxin-antitoxin system
MNLLFDTNAFLWWTMVPEKFSRKALNALDEADRVYFSPVTLWEIGLKASGKGFDFPLPTNWHLDLPNHAERFRVDSLTISPLHCRMIQDLPFHHRDPFDRMLIAQALDQKLAVITSDEVFHRYGAEIIW